MWVFLRTSFHNKVLYGRLIRATGAGRAIARADSLAVVSDLDALGDGLTAHGAFEIEPLAY